jgi:quercetin dioxygenase-like cupin family protein
MSNLAVRDQIMALEAQMRQMPQVEIPVKHYFAHGLYAREIFIPKGVILTGLIHRQSQINFCLKGDISVATEQGYRRVLGGETIVSPAGIKRAAYAHEDTIWTTVLGTFMTDPGEIEAALTTPLYEELSCPL